MNFDHNLSTKNARRPSKVSKDADIRLFCFERKNKEIAH